MQGDKYYYFPKGYDKKVLLIGDSFSGGLLKFLSYTFKYTLIYVDNNRKMHFYTYKDAIDDYKPDIIIINIRSFYTIIFRNLHIEEKIK